MTRPRIASTRGLVAVGTLLAAILALAGCSSSGVSTSVGVGYGYGGYYGPYYGSGYYPGYYYPPVVIDPPNQRPERPNGGDRPTTLPAYPGGATTLPASRPPSASRPTTRPSPRPTPRPMPRAGGMRR
jgi:hypothetical protein